jgi:hypothetical protein
LVNVREQDAIQVDPAPLEVWVNGGILEVIQSLSHLFQLANKFVNRHLTIRVYRISLGLQGIGQLLAENGQWHYATTQLTVA